MSQHFTDEGRPLTDHAREAIAHHAAGRAVIGLVLGRKLSMVGMNANGITDVQFESADRNLIFTPIDAFAGIAARAQFDPNLPQFGGYDGDWSQFCDLVPNEKDQRRYIAIARSLVQSNWSKIQSVAQRLVELQRLSGSEVTKITGPLSLNSDPDGYDPAKKE